MRSRRGSHRRRHDQLQGAAGQNARERLAPLEIGALVAVCAVFVIGLGFLVDGRSAVRMPVGAPPPVKAMRSPSSPETDSVQQPAPLLEEGSKALPGDRFACRDPEVVDGDTIRCSGQRIRLAAIDAPELPGHCRRGRDCVAGDPYASSNSLMELIGSGEVVCRQVDVDRFGRIVAQCTTADADLSCEQVARGHAVVRYGALAC